ncbi:MAG: hypothetical protein MJ233_00400 [Mycoplasmoidaceae bacterium]|nr:hypothetical protein [Mycoplasmoidaceae bacterium]
MEEKQYLNFVNKFVTVDFGEFANKKDEIILLFKKQISYAQQLNDFITQTFLTPINFDKDFRMKLAGDIFQKTLHAFSELLNKINEPLTPDIAKDLINKTKELSGNKGPDLFMPIRLAITGIEHGPELNKIISIIGKDLIKQRLSKVLLYK